MAINLRGASYKNAVLTHAELDQNFLDFMSLSGTGANVTITSINAPNFNSTSDARLKENIVKIESALDKVKRLNGYTFNFTSDETKTPHSGVLAQECQEAFPVVVATKEDHLTVSYDGLVPLLLEAIKEQQTQIEAQNEKIKQLESIVNDR